MFGNLGATEIIFIMVIVLRGFGAKRLPEIGQSLGKGIREFKKSMSRPGPWRFSFQGYGECLPSHSNYVELDREG